MALVVVERVVDETGVPAVIEVVEMESDSDAEEHRALGSPTVLVDGRDVDLDPTLWGTAPTTASTRRSRPCGWPDRVDPNARRRAQTTSNGTSPVESSRHKP